ncbi:MAG TPA: hypothetical protein PLB89_04695 [Flavobacteriales bacterium]|nr:hypothetical protein [Flavobacteriales bacterium]
MKLLERIKLWIKLWVQPELDRTRQLLRQANKQLDHALRENRALKVEKDELEQQIKDMIKSGESMSATIQRLEERDRERLEIMERMEQQQSEAARTQAATNDAVKMLQDQLRDMRAQLGYPL